MKQPCIYFQNHNHARKTASDLGDIITLIDQLNLCNGKCNTVAAAQLKAFVPRLETLHEAVTCTALQTSTPPDHE